MKFETLPAWLEWLEQQHPKSIDLGLERVSQVAERLCLTTPRPHVITVAGTNGKGSFVATLDALLRVQGLRVGCYTSPHFLHFNERIRINGIDVDDARLLQAFAAVNDALQGISLTYFEFTTLAALWCFQQTELDYLILEVGLGGRLDAVNIIQPDWAVITSIGLDHQDYLGDTLDAIATEKCGILREDTPLICAEPTPPAVLQQVIAVHTALVIGRDFELTSSGHQWQLEDTAHNLRYGELADNGLSLPSQAAAVVLANRLLPEPLPQSVVQQVLAELTLTGRFQHINDDGVDIFLDVAHNPQAATMLHQRLQAWPLAEGNKRLAVFNIARDKDAAEVIRLLKADFAAWFLFTIDNPRLYNPTDLAATVHQQGINMISVSKNARQALARARSMCNPSDQIVIFGSFFVVAELLPRFQRQGCSV